MEEEGAVCRSGGAEAVLNLEQNASISVAYHNLFGPHDDLLLLEIDDKLIPHILSNRVTVRGQPDEDAVLCTPSTTYALKFVGTSNSVFLIPPSQIDDSVTASVIKLAPGVMELVEVAPKLENLKFLLDQNHYRGEDEDEGSVDGLYRWEDLVERVQASDEELRQGLQTFSAVDIFGYWRIVDDTYMGMVISTFFNNSVLNGWSLDALNEEQVVGMLESDGFPRAIAHHCLQLCANKVDGGGDLWKLDEKRVCVRYAKSVLATGEGKMKMELFMDKWTQKIPAGISPSFEMLEGHVLLERLGVETWVRLYSVSNLPLAPAQRFAALFQERQKWESKDLQPYIRDLRVPGLSSEGLLLKYTRRTQPTSEAEPIFSAR